MMKNGVVKKWVASGEERVGKLVQQLMANEKFVAGVQAMIGRALAAKGTLDKSLRTALSAMSVPSASDVDALRERVDALEKAVSAQTAKLERLGDAKPEPKKK